MSQLPTLPKTRQTGSSRGTTVTANSGDCVGGKGTRAEPLHSTSVSAPTRSHSGNLNPPTDDSGIANTAQALAVIRPGLVWLARNCQLILCNDNKTGVAWIGLPDMKILETGEIVPTQEALAGE